MSCIEKGYSHPLLRCLTPSEAEYVMQEINEGICGDHLGVRLLTQKVFKQGCSPVDGTEGCSPFGANLRLLPEICSGTMATSRAFIDHVESFAISDLGN